MALRGVLFDLDGTLADTPAAERDTWPGLAAVLVRHVPDVDLEVLHTRYDSAFEPHWQAFLEGRIDFAEYRRARLSEAMSPWSEVDDTLFDAYRIEKRRAVDRLRPFGDAVSTLRELRGAGLKVGLLTNGPSWLQRRKLEVTGLDAELDGIAISEEIGVAKPDAAAFALAAALIGCVPAEVAMIGDSPAYDIMGALAAGLPAAILVTGELAIEADGAIAVSALAEVPAALGVSS